MSAIRTLAVAATDNGLLAPELAAGIARVKSAKSIGVRIGHWLSLKHGPLAYHDDAGDGVEGKCDSEDQRMAV